MSKHQNESAYDHLAQINEDAQAAREAKEKIAALQSVLHDYQMELLSQKETIEQQPLDYQALLNKRTSELEEGLRARDEKIAALTYTLASSCDAAGLATGLTSALPTYLRGCLAKVAEKDARIQELVKAGNEASALLNRCEEELGVPAWNDMPATIKLLKARLVALENQPANPSSQHVAELDVEIRAKSDRIAELEAVVSLAIASNRQFAELAEENKSLEEQLAAASGPWQEGAVEFYEQTQGKLRRAIATTCPMAWYAPREVCHQCRKRADYIYAEILRYLREKPKAALVEQPKLEPERCLNCGILTIGLVATPVGSLCSGCCAEPYMLHRRLRKLEDGFESKES